ncbi:MAG: hypothetical protein JNK95_08950 [Candidatus Competibacter sp.]|nr:hypothetical protein [Candidatus Competibacter sp.]
MTIGIRIEGLAGATLDMDGMERIALEPQERLKLLARVQIPPIDAGDPEDSKERETDKKTHDQRRTVTFIIEPLAGATGDSIRREEPFYVPDSH